MGILTHILGGWHLPLNPLDQINQPPLEFLQVQDGLLLIVGVFWTTSYILSCRDAFRDRSYGIPLLTLFFRTLGTGLIVTMHVWQWYNYPQDHPIMALPITLYCVFLFEGADLIYPFAFTFISKYETQQKFEKKNGDKRLR
ncbi:hypothetical protein S40285_10642 [Stachybotrys chlorohalonatus IBT 40285]|uniref:Uncharacterized protein n=1 Tax=Stachybotrys chlorohalonatus (strain IBT 40285) TaxID=1283841 RepID=A0A084QQL1_STAC4|nr:hypothetical protein S40285_10642 [Stachybotrys chlorohalonata IBT 40285]